MHLAKRKGGVGLSSRRPPLAPKSAKAADSKALMPNYRRFAIAVATLLSLLFVLLYFQERTHQELGSPISRKSAIQAACTPHPLVCAHNVVGSDLNARTGSIDLLSELWKSGIRCVGLSVTPLKDSLVVREAARIQHVSDNLRSKLPPDEPLIPLIPTHEQVLEWANGVGVLATEDFPTLERALRWFQDTVKASGGVKHAETLPVQRWFGQSDKTSSLDTSEPLLILTIEGENVKTADYSATAQLVASFGLSHHVGVIVPEGAAHRDAFAGALASASPEIYRGLSVTSDANTDAQRSRKLGSTLYDFLAPNAESAEAMLAAARAPGKWKPTIATGLMTNSALNTTLQYNFPVIMTSDALRFHRSVQARADACQNSVATGSRTSSDMHSFAQAHLQGQGVVGAFSTVSATTTTTTSTTTTSVMMGDNMNHQEALQMGQQDTAADEAESAQAGGVGDHDLEQKAAAVLRLERVAAAAAANATSSTATALASGADGSVVGDSTMHRDDALGADAVSTISSMHGGMTYTDMHTLQSDLNMGTGSEGDAGSNTGMMNSAVFKRHVTLPEDEQPQVEVEGGVVKNATHELAPAGSEDVSNPALEAQPGTAAPVLRARVNSQSHRGVENLTHSLW